MNTLPGRGLRWLVFFIILAAVATVVGAEGPGPLRVGLASADITPAGPVWMRGFAARKKPSEGVHRSLYAHCVVFDNGQTRMAIVALDLCALSYRQLLNLRAAAAREGIPPQHLMVNWTHTHFGPHLGSIEPHRRNLEYDAVFTERTQPLFTAAVADLQPAMLRYALGSSVMGINRRQLNAEGRSVGMRPEPRKPIDPDVPVLEIRTADQAIRAVLFGYACHPTTIGGTGPYGYLIGTDYPGYARDWVEAAYPGATAIFLQGCGGDIKPRAIRPRAGGDARFGTVLLDDKEVVASVGHELGRAVVAALAVAEEKSDAEPQAVPLGGIVELVAFPARDDPSQPASMPFHVGAWRLGDVYLFGSQGEVLSAIGRRIKDTLAPLPVWTGGYTHWGGGYFPDAAAYPEGGYEIRNTAFAPAAEDLLVETALRQIRQLQEQPVHTDPIPLLPNVEESKKEASPQQYL